MGEFGSLAPSLARLDMISLDEANRALTVWGHKMGPMTRPAGIQEAVGLFADERLVAVAITADLVAPTCAGFTRDEAVELARVCSCEPWANRVIVRMWREIVFPAMQKSRPSLKVAVSYQDATLHSGNLYRFDGWERIAYSASGTDRRSGRTGRKKWIWAWPARALEQEGRDG